MRDLTAHTPDVFPAANDAQSTMALRWLQLGVLALGLSGLFALLLVLSRTPGSETFFPWVDFFRTALVVHVDQSVLIWFLAMAGLLWSLAMPQDRRHLLLQRIAIGLALIGTLGIAVAAFVGEGAPLMNNYVPVLQRPLFFASLGLLVLGVAIQALLALRVTRTLFPMDAATQVVDLAAFTVAVAVLIALSALVTAWWQIPAGVAGQGFYEYLFWGAGHTLQFAYTQLMLFAWLLLAWCSGVEIPLRRRWILWLLLLGVAPVVATPLIYLFYETLTIESRTAFIRQMQFGGGIAAIPIGLFLLLGLRRSKQAVGAVRPLRRCLWMSLLLFFAGGFIGMLISGTNTIIPAHYHGSIVGVTLALMGLVYLLLPRFGYAPVAGRMADLQPWIYGFGQLLHIIGLALSGAMGIQRKTAGTAQGLESLATKMTMGVMGLGGLLAVIGGILFVWLMLRAFWRGRTETART